MSQNNKCLTKRCNNAILFDHGDRHMYGFKANKGRACVASNRHRNCNCGCSCAFRHLVSVLFRTCLFAYQVGQADARMVV